MARGLETLECETFLVTRALSLSTQYHLAFQVGNNFGVETEVGAEDGVDLRTTAGRKQRGIIRAVHRRYTQISGQ